MVNLKSDDSKNWKKIEMRMDVPESSKDLDSSLWSHSPMGQLDHRMLDDTELLQFYICDDYIVSF